MEWLPKSLDSIDSAALALYQSWTGYYRWVIFRLVLSVAAIAVMLISPAIRQFSIALVMTYAAIEMIDWLISHRKKLRVARTRG